MRRLLLAALALSMLAACGSPRREEPLVGPVAAADARVAQGERVFMRKCHACHPKGSDGLGPALNNKPLPNFLVAWQVRRGLGAMPAFDEGEIDDAALEALLAYVVALRNAG